MTLEEYTIPIPLVWPGGWMRQKYRGRLSKNILSVGEMMKNFLSVFVYEKFLSILEKVNVKEKSKI
jgi:hypothetical protein